MSDTYYHIYEYTADGPLTDVSFEKREKALGYLLSQGVRFPLALTAIDCAWAEDGIMVYGRNKRKFVATIF